MREMTKFHRSNFALTTASAIETMPCSSSSAWTSPYEFYDPANHMSPHFPTRSSKYSPPTDCKWPIAFPSDVKPSLDSLYNQLSDHFNTNENIAKWVISFILLEVIQK